MAISLLGRTLIATPKPNLLPSILQRSKFLSFSSVSSRSPRLVGGVRFRRMEALRELPRVAGVVHASRCFSTGPATSSLDEKIPPNKDDGCDFEHWLIVVEKPDESRTRDDIIGNYIKTAAAVIGSEEEARKKIYLVSTRHYFAFGIIVSEEDSCKFKDLPGVRMVLPDSYLHLRNKDYGGEPFINGEAVPYDPKYHEEWVRNNTYYCCGCSKRPRSDAVPNAGYSSPGGVPKARKRDLHAVEVVLPHPSSRECPFPAP